MPDYSMEDNEITKYYKFLREFLQICQNLINKRFKLNNSYYFNGEESGIILDIGGRLPFIKTDKKG